VAKVLHENMTKRSSICAAPKNRFTICKQQVELRDEITRHHASDVKDSF
jgi:hypothetical protein